MKKILLLIIVLLLGAIVFLLERDYSRTIALKSASSVAAENMETSGMNDSSAKSDVSKVAQKDSLDKTSLNLEKEKKAKAEAERIKKENEEKAKAEAERIKKENEEKAKAEAERIKKENEEKAKTEAERIKKENEEKAKVEVERIKKENEEKAKAEAERLKRELASAPEKELVRKEFASFEQFIANKAISSILKSSPERESEKYRPFVQAVFEAKDLLTCRRAFEIAKNKFSEKRQELLTNRLSDLATRLSKLKTIRSGLPETILSPLGTLLSEARELAELDVRELAPKRKSFVEELLSFQKDLEDQRPQFLALQSYDKLGESWSELSSFMRSFCDRFPDSVYSKNFVQLNGLESILKALSAWNDFILEYGKRLDCFAVEPSAASAALDFCCRYDGRLFPFSEWTVLKSHEEEFRSVHDIPVRQKISALLNYAGQTDFWICHRHPEHWIYLVSAPKVGSNFYQTDLFDGRKEVILSSEEVHLIRKAEQTEFFRILGTKADAIQDTLRYSDPGRWYADWADLVRSIKKNEAIDPLVKILYLKDICIILADSDYYFNRRLSSWIRVLSTEPFDSGVNWFDADDEKTEQYRRNAKTLLAFLNDADLEVSVKTKELNASVTPVSFVYRRIGWLDRDFNGSPYFRGSLEVRKIDLSYDVTKNSIKKSLENQVALKKSKVEKSVAFPDVDLLKIEMEPKGSFRFQKIGRYVGGQFIFDPAAKTVPVGTPIFCRRAAHK